MQLEYDKEILIRILEAVELKGKYFSSGSLKSDSLGEYVKIVPINNHWKTGYHFMNGDNQTFVSHYMPDIIEEDDGISVVLEIPKLMKYLKTMSGRIRLNIDEVCNISSENKEVVIPVSVLHPNDVAISRLFECTIEKTFTDELEPIMWGNDGTTSQFEIENAFQITGSKLISIMNSCESVGHGVYTFYHSGNTLAIMSSIGNEHYIERVNGINSIGAATVSFTGPIHKALDKLSMCNVYFNDDSLMLIISGLVTIVRAPYVVVE